MVKNIEELKNIKSIKDMRFTLTKEMQDTIIKLLIINQMLKENEDLSYKEIKLLKKEKDNLMEHFASEFKAHNIEKVILLRSLLDK